MSVLFTSLNNDVGHDNRGTGFYIRYRAVKGIKCFLYKSENIINTSGKCN